MGQLGFYFDMNSCSGCRTCQIACKDRNDLPIGVLYRSVHSFEVGKFPDAKMFHYSKSCNHCASPECVANCPTGAMQKADDGTVIHDDAKCIGCGTCVESCPYEVPVLRSDTGIAGKCDACHALREAGKNPACVDACLMRCLDFGDVEELAAKYGTEYVHDLPFLPDSSVTSPATLIVPKECAKESSFTEVPI